MFTKQLTVLQASFYAISFGFAFAACGGSEPLPKFDASPTPNPPTPDAPVVYVYVTPDAAPPTCVCACTDSCACSCDCGTGQPIVVLLPDCIPTVVNNDDASAPPSAIDPPTDATATKFDAVPDAIVVKDSLSTTDQVVNKTDTAPASDSIINRDLSAPSDAAPDNRTSIPDTLPDTAPDLTPPPDTRPCTTATCRCPADSVCMPTALMTIPTISDYSVLGYSYFTKNIAGFGLYQAAHSSSYMTVEVGVTVGDAPAYQTDIAYSTSSGTFSVTTGAMVGYSDWWSLKRQFTGQIDECGCSGISLDIKGDISKPRPEATARFTLADIVCRDANGNILDGGSLSDELWLYDIKNSEIAADWKTIQIPLDSFRNGGIRSNDGKLDLRCVQGFEINYQYNATVDCRNVTCDKHEQIIGSNHFEIRNLTTY